MLEVSLLLKKKKKSDLVNVSPKSNQGMNVAVTNTFILGSKKNIIYLPVKGSRTDFYNTPASFQANLTTSHLAFLECSVYNIFSLTSLLTKLYTNTAVQTLSL